MPPRPRREKLTEQDRRDWASFARQLRLLPGDRSPTCPRRIPRLRRPQPRGCSTAAASIVAAAAGTARRRPAGARFGTWNRFRSGKLAAARTLDLHGRTAQRAFHALQHFLHAAHADQVRCVEVITGRGTGEAGGVIRRELPLWLNLPTLRPLILAASHPHAANPGSVRLLLRRPK